ncbi:hypothetical protein UCRPA7_6218 [Phaeoacremonium minimum UCRPA7]|uniref:Uncharacterized protein n=1 Tax=Phaeoacremonium minimum (strain UCR-PA7) TaxID=1286976 RepID=R8BG44_PHAM7|nr:hypothetical protein UCRPA7_6218 [Phaeoacremonium minimum UCRPA7]EON98257.1 hypothetical protein UCRPA7_6218 [Phaeoacremonium minimum UCRPA7]
MVAFKNLLLIAAAFVGVIAQDDAPEGDTAAAQAYWDQVLAGAETQTGDAVEKRSLIHAARTVEMKDPYKGSICTAPFTAPPCETHCTRNNCFRGFLNARDGSSGKHCPKEAFGFCCAWNYAPDFIKWYAVKYDILYAVAPYASSCKSSDDTAWDVVNKVNDVCGCTLNHEVTIDTSNAYYGLRALNPGNSKCH